MLKTINALLLTLLFCSWGYGQIMTFEFSALAGNEATAVSNTNDPNIAAGTISRGAGLTAATNAGRYNATNWSAVSIADAVANNKYMEFTITPNVGCNFSVSSIVVQLQRSGTGPSAIALRSSADGFTANLDAIYPIVDNTSTQSFTFTFTQSNITAATTYRFYMFAESVLGSGGPGDGVGNDIVVNGTTSCGTSNTITTGAVTGAPFNIDCSVPTPGVGTVAFTSTGAFVLGNIYTAQLSDASGSFVGAINIGTLTSIANSGVINVTIPAAMPSGSNYQIRVIADNPATTGTNSAAFTINQASTCVPAIPTTPGLIINEWSNGPAGSQEFYEFVVAGQCGESVDIRGFILDDNNGTFTDPVAYATLTPTSGIAQGHFRFSNDPQWASIPVGSLIVVYNFDDPNPALPPDDPTDANTDSLYVVPHNSPLFESCSSIPVSYALGPPPIIGDSTYSPCTYGTGGSWNGLGIRNAGDAIQVRNPDGSYYHGVSYGGAEITGGPHNLKLFSGSGSGMCGWFNDGDFFDISNWSSGAVGGNETPGLPNNTLNYEWLKLMRDTTTATCPIVLLPVEIISFTGLATQDGNRLWWATASESNSSHFVIERSHDGKHWRPVGQSQAAGHSLSMLNYNFLDLDFEAEENYYRLIQYDTNGEKYQHNRLVFIDNSENKGIHIVGHYNTMGQQVDPSYRGIQIILFDDGHTEKVMNY